MTRARGPKTGGPGHRTQILPTQSGPRAWTERLKRAAPVFARAAPELARVLLDAAAESSEELRVLRRIVRVLDDGRPDDASASGRSERPEVLCAYCGTSWTAGHDCKRRQRT